jgi:hypothetical protein
MKTSAAFAILRFAPLVCAAAPSVDLSLPKAVGSRDYVTTTQCRSYTPDGTGTLTATYSASVTVTRDESGRQSLVCQRFTFTGADGTPHAVPALTGWTHVLDVSANEVLGIPHSDFAALACEDGTPLPPDVSYGVYNTFVDFYAFTNIFADAAPGGSVADQKQPGETIRHHSADSRAPVNLGSSVEEGSYFQNGAATLSFKGYAAGDDNAPALIGFDSGDSSFLMLMEPAPGMKMTVKGGSHYWGEMTIDTATRWAVKSTFTEIVICRMNCGTNPPMDSVVVRKGFITSKD